MPHPHSLKLESQLSSLACLSYPKMIIHNNSYIYNNNNNNNNNNKLYDPNQSITVLI